MPEVDNTGAKRPNLVEFPGGAAERPESESRWSERLGRSSRLLALLGLLLLLSLVALVAQSQRAEKLAGEVAALTSQMEAANRRLAAFQAQRELVRDSLGGVLEELSGLHAVVSEDPLAVTEPAEAP